MATEKWTTVHPIPWRNTSFTYLPYWLYDIIVDALRKATTGAIMRKKNIN